MKQTSPPHCLGLVLSTVMGMKTRTAGEIVQRAKGLQHEDSSLCRSLGALSAIPALLLRRKAGVPGAWQAAALACAVGRQRPRSQVKLSE